MGRTVHGYWSTSAPNANLVPMIHSVMRRAGRQYWLTYRSVKSTAAAPLYDKSLINFRTSQSHCIWICPISLSLSVWAGVTGRRCSVPSAVIHFENIWTDGAGGQLQTQIFYGAEWKHKTWDQHTESDAFMVKLLQYRLQLFNKKHKEL